MSTDMAVDHVNGNGTEESTEPMDTAAVEVTRSEHFQTLLDAGLPQKVAEKLDEVYIAGTVCCYAITRSCPSIISSCSITSLKLALAHLHPLWFDACWSCSIQLF
jgi:hypothetical protein